VNGLHKGVLIGLPIGLALWFGITLIALQFVP
jgi:hypothetical protein